MATITQTVEEFLPTSITKRTIPLRTKMTLSSKTKQELPPQTLGCPPDCSCKLTKSYQPRQLFFNALGIIIALIATYMIVTTDSNLYLIFWVAYSVLRRLTRSKAHVKKD